MDYIKTNGIIVRETPVGDGDRSITVIGEGIGKFYAYVRGARKTRSKLSAATDFLAYSEFVIYKKRENYEISSCEMKESFFPLREDTVLLTYASHMAEVFTDMVSENQKADELLKLFLNTLSILAKNTKDPLFLTRIYEFRAICLSGYMPILDKYTCCIEKKDQDTENLPTDKLFFCYDQGGLICGDCYKKYSRSTEISIGCLKALMYIAYSDNRRLFSFTVDKTVLNELNIVIPAYLERLYEKRYTKLEYIKKLK